MEANIKMITIHGAVCRRRAKGGQHKNDYNRWSCVCNLSKKKKKDGAVSVGEEGIERGREGETA